MKRIFCSIAAVLPALAHAAPGIPVAPGPQPRLSVPTSYFHDSVICKDTVTYTSCQLLLDADGRYTVAFDRGRQTLAPSIDGPWQIEARVGHYVLRSFKGAAQLCLTPDGGSGSYESERVGEPFAGAGCYPFALHQTGEQWILTDDQGRAIKIWLVAGR